MTKHTRVNLILIVIVAGLIASGLIVARDRVLPTIAAQSAAPAVVPGRSVEAIGLETFRDIAKAQTPMVVNIRTDALVRLVERDGPAAAAGIQPGDVIVRYNDKAVQKSADLVEMVTRTKPGTSVPVEVVRSGQGKTLNVKVGTLELDEQEGRSGSSETGFGMSLRDLAPQQRSQLQVPSGRGGALVSDVQPASAAARAGVRPGDVVLEVNRAGVKSAADASAAFRRVGEQGTALVLAWRDGQEVFLTVTGG